MAGLFLLAVDLVYPEGTQLPGEGKEGDLVLSVLKQILLFAAFLLSALSIIAFLISAIIYVTSYGNTDRIELAKRSLKYAVIGTVIGLLSVAFIMAITNLLNGLKPDEAPTPTTPPPAVSV